MNAGTAKQRRGGGPVIHLGGRQVGVAERDLELVCGRPLVAPDKGCVYGCDELVAKIHDEVFPQQRLWKGRKKGCQWRGRVCGGTGAAAGAHLGDASAEHGLPLRADLAEEGVGAEAWVGLLLLVSIAEGQGLDEPGVTRVVLGKGGAVAYVQG